MAMQGRVAYGASGQQKVANYFKSKHNATIISVATPGSNTTDIVLTIKNKKYHVEVKGAESLLNEVYVFDVSSSRSNTNFDFLNELARSMLVASGKKLETAVGNIPFFNLGLGNKESTFKDLTGKDISTGSRWLMPYVETNTGKRTSASKQAESDYTKFKNKI